MLPIDIRNLSILCMHWFLFFFKRRGATNQPWLPPEPCLPSALVLSLCANRRSDQVQLWLFWIPAHACSCGSAHLTADLHNFNCTAARGLALGPRRSLRSCLQIEVWFANRTEFMVWMLRTPELGHENQRARHCITQWACWHCPALKQPVLRLVEVSQRAATGH